GRGGAPAGGRAGAAWKAVQGGAGGVELGHGPEEEEERAGGGWDDAGDLWHRRNGGGGVGGVGGEPHGQHGVRGATQRHGPQPQRAAGEEDVQLLEGLVDSSGGELLEQVQ